MSSSEDEAVRRPGRGGRAYNGDVSDEEDNANISAPENDQADDNDDKDLFGSGSEPDLDECVSILAPNVRLALANRRADAHIALLTIRTSTLATTRDVMTGKMTAWIWVKMKRKDLAR